MLLYERDFLVRKAQNLNFLLFILWYIDWTIDYNLFTTLPPSDEFEVHYSPIPINIEEEIETTVDENSDGPIEKKHEQSESSTEPSNSKTSIRRGTKRKLGNEEISIDDSSFSLRRSSRLRKVLTMESASIVSSKTISQVKYTSNVQYESNFS